MKLYTYDHCPYCVRAKMIFGLRGIDFTEIVLPYDDEKTPVALVGQKQVPILQQEDGQAMAESLDIVQFIDDKAGGEKLATEYRPEIAAWLESIRQLYIKLTSPREIRLGLPEFATQSAIDYFVNKKTPHYGDFTDNFAQTTQYKTQLEAALLTLEPLINSPTQIGEKLGYEDILVFPILRNLTQVKGLVFPPKVRAYIDEMSKQSGIALYDQRAI